MKKKILLWALIFAFTALCFSGKNVKADELSGNAGPNATWTLDANGLLTVSGKGEMYFDNMNDYLNFDDYSLIKKVKIENGITGIGYAAFFQAGFITEVSIPNSVTYIGESAFESCDSLTSITIPNSVRSIGKRAFDSCYNLSSVSIPGSVTEIGEKAFQSCRSLTALVLPNSVIKLGDAAFNDCYNLKSITCSCALDLKGKIPDTTTITKKHSMSGWKKTKAATVFTAGKLTRTCSRCKKAETKSIAKLKATIKLSKTKVTIRKKKYYTLKISGLAKGDSVKSVKTSKKSVAAVKKLKVNQYKIRGRKKGNAKITVILKSGKKAVMSVKVKK